jgi:hypothetical protein
MGSGSQGRAGARRRGQANDAPHHPAPWGDRRYSPTKHHGTNYVDIVIIGQGGRYLR